MHHNSLAAAAYLWATRHHLLRGRLRKLARKAMVGATYDVDVDGIRLRCQLVDNSTERSLLLHGSMAESVGLARAMDRLHPGDVFVDVGANCGVFTAVGAGRVGPTGRVIAIEPLPALLERLRFNVNANGFSNVSIFETAIGEVSGTATIYVNDSDQGKSSLAANSKSHRALHVPVSPLAAVIAASGADRIDFMKIDIEGFEDRALLPFVRDAPRTVWPRMIFMETQLRERWEADCVQALLDAGYRKAWQDETDILLELAAPALTETQEQDGPVTGSIRQY